MNEHFRASKDLRNDDYRPPRQQIPNRGYGRVDHVEFNLERPNSALVAIDFVDAEWLDLQGQQDAKFLVNDDSRRTAAWKFYKEQRSRNVQLPNPFEMAPVFRLEVELDIGETWFGLPYLPPRSSRLFDVALGSIEAQWIELDHISKFSDSTPEGAGLLYTSLFSEPIPVLATGRLPTPQQGTALNDIFSLANLPEADEYNLGLVLSKSSTEYLAVYDVGQGNANALLSCRRRPTMYFDMGAGVYRNRHTTPVGLRFCVSEDPVVILSHWDADHWAGACATSIGGHYPALQSQWIAPLQVVGPVHIAFAFDLATRGNLHIYSPSLGTIVTTTSVTGQLTSVTTGSGSTRNSSGLVLCIENSTLPQGPGSWLLTGDCDYRYFMSPLNPAPSIALVVPHHGADLDSTFYPGPTTKQTYRRIVYSFGKNNAHGKTSVQHPTMAGVDAHDSAGWNHGAWIPMTSSPGYTRPYGDAIATCEHSPGTFRNGAIIGWTSAPTPSGLPCSGLGCSTSLLQS